MGINIKIGSWTFQASEYSVEESATPLAAGDSNGSVGTISFSIPEPDPYLPPASTGSGWDMITRFGSDILLGMPVELTDSRRGLTEGTVATAARDDSSGLLRFTATSRLGDLNIYNVQAQPFVGTLSGVLTYYLSLSAIEADLIVDSSVASRQVAYPGWFGELWYHLKMLAAAQDLDISLIDGNVEVRPIRTESAIRGQDVSRSRDIPIPTLAQSVEVYLYRNRQITNELVYPIGGWTEETEILNVNAGEDAEYTLELSASVDYIQPPVMQTNVGPSHNTSSVYTIVANDGLPVSAAMWSDKGGTLSVTIEPDTTSLKVKLHGAKGIPTSAGEEASNFSVALGSDTTGNRYSTLRIVASGVGYEKEKRTIPTGVTAQQTGTEIGVTIDNPFISTINELYGAGTRAARQYAGAVPTLSATVVGTKAPPEFGSVAGMRLWDRKSKRYFRIRSATISPDGISASGDDDLTFGDADQFYAGSTYTQVQALNAGLTYKQSELAGLHD